MKLVISLFVLLVVSACSHHHNADKHHHHQFNKMCAYEITQNHLDVKASDEIKLEHEGETYYFSSQDKKKKFEENLSVNIKKSKENWLNGQSINK